MNVFSRCSQGVCDHVSLQFWVCFCCEHTDMKLPDSLLDNMLSKFVLRLFPPLIWSWISTITVSTHYSTNNNRLNSWTSQSLLSSLLISSLLSDLFTVITLLFVGHIVPMIKHSNTTHILDLPIFIFHLCICLNVQIRPNEGANL